MQAVLTTWLFLGPFTPVAQASPGPQVLLVQNKSEPGSTAGKKPVKIGQVYDPPETVAARQAETLKGHDREVAALKFHPSGAILMSGGSEGAYITWDVGAYIRKKKGAVARAVLRRNNSDHISAVDFDSTGRFFAVSGVTRWGNGFGSNLGIFTPYRKDPYGFGCDCAWSWTCVSIDPLGRYFMMGSLNRQLTAVSLLPKKDTDGKVVPVLAAKNAVDVPEEVWRVHCHPVYPLTVAGGRNGWVHLYTIGLDGVSNHKVQVPGHPGGGISGLKFTPDGESLVSVAHDKRLKVWDLETGAEKKSFPTLDALPEWCDLHPVFPWVVIAYNDGKAQIVNYETGAQVALLTGHQKALRSAVFHPEGHWVATAGNDFLIKLWDLEIQPIYPKYAPKPTVKK